MFKIRANFPGRCPLCSQPYPVGATIMWSRQFGVEMCMPCRRKDKESAMERLTGPSRPAKVVAGRKTNNNNATNNKGE